MLTKVMSLKDYKVVFTDGKTFFVEIFNEETGESRYRRPKNKEAEEIIQFFRGG